MNTLNTKKMTTRKLDASTLVFIAMLIVAFIMILTALM